MVPPAKKLEDLIHLAELCVDLLQQNEEHYAEVSSVQPFPSLFTVVDCSYGFTRFINVVTIITSLNSLFMFRGSSFSSFLLFNIFQAMSLRLKIRLRKREGRNIFSSCHHFPLSQKCKKNPSVYHSQCFPVSSLINCLINVVIMLQ